jgi:hypothetical protein
MILGDDLTLEVEAVAAVSWGRVPWGGVTPPILGEVRG